MRTTNKSLRLIAAASLFALTGCYNDTVTIAPSPQPGYSQPAPDDSASVDLSTTVDPATFTDQLSPYGQWVVTADYGNCWVPNQVSADWQPYTVGSWSYTDYGWTWVSNEPWDDVTCHYGRWAHDNDRGWVWVAGGTWGPAWVAFRNGGGYVGWAPLPPQGTNGDILVSADEINAIPAASFAFVQEGDILDQNIQQHFVDHTQNVTIINKTVNITNIQRNSNHMENRSLSVDEVQRATGKTITPQHLTVVTDPKKAAEMRQKGQPVAFVPAKAKAAPRAQTPQPKPEAQQPTQRPDEQRPQQQSPEIPAQPRPVPEQTTPRPNDEHPQTPPAPREQTPKSQTPAQSDQHQPAPKAPEKAPPPKQDQATHAQPAQPSDKQKKPEPSDQSKQQPDKQPPNKQPNNPPDKNQPDKDQPQT
jgi:hypothetical protein